jgi:hypothetical protein
MFARKAGLVFCLERVGRSRTAAVTLVGSIARFTRVVSNASALKKLDSLTASLIHRQTNRRA